MPVDDVITAAADWNARSHADAMLRDYYNGNHQLKFATQNFVEKYGPVVLGLRENLCPAVVSAFCDQMTITGWTGEKGDTKRAVDATLEQGIERLNDLANREAFLSGDAYALVWPNKAGEQVPVFHRGNQGVPHVDPLDPQMLDWWAKPWIDSDKHGRCTVYYADRAERWRTNNPLLPSDNRDTFLGDVYPTERQNWVRYSGDGEGDTLGHDHGVVPVVWWRHDSSDQYSHGRSILNDVVPLQDALNKSVADLVVTSEGYSRPFWYLLNHDPEVTINPDTGMPVAQQAKFDPTRGQIFSTNGPGPFGQLDPPDLTKLADVQDRWALKIARVVGVPAYYFTQTSGDVPSGASLRVLGTRLTSRVSTYNRTSRPVWRGLLELMGVDDVWPVFQDPLPPSELERLEVAHSKRELGYPLLDVLQDLGEQDAEDIAGRAATEQSTSASTAGRFIREGNLQGELDTES